MNHNSMKLLLIFLRLMAVKICCRVIHLTVFSSTEPRVRFPVSLPPYENTFLSLDHLTNVSDRIRWFSSNLFLFLPWHKFYLNSLLTIPFFISLRLRFPQVYCCLLLQNNFTIQTFLIHSHSHRDPHLWEGKDF